MKCRLCDRPTAAGTGKLCADCAKALRRARAAPTSALRKLRLSQPNALETSAAADVALTVAAAVAPAQRSKRPAAWAAIGLVGVAVAIVIVYVGQSELTGPSNAGTTVGRSPASSTDRPRVEAAAPRVEEPSWTALGNAAETEGSPATSQLHFNAGTTPVAPPSVASAGAKTSGKPGSTRKKPNQDAKAAPPPTAIDNDATPTKPPESEPPPQLALASVSPSVQPADGAQVLASAMEKCGKESFLSKFICEQKTYMQYCEDKWEKDPRCMRKTAER